MNYINQQLGEEEENCINNILEKGLEEIKNSQCGSVSTSNNNNNFNAFQSQYRKTYNISSYDNPLKLTNSNLNNVITNYTNIDSVEKSLVHHDSISTKINPINDINNQSVLIQNEEKENQIRPSNTQKLKEMQMKLDNLQSRISGLDKRLTTSNYVSSLASYGGSRPQTPKSSYKRSKSKKRSYSSNSSRSTSKKNAKNINDSIWKERYLKLKSTYNEDKTLLIKLRQQKNELSKKLERLSKKESLYDELFETNEKIIENNESLFSQLEESEEVRIEQEKLIYSLQKEVQRLRGNFEKNDLLKRSTKTKGHKMK